MADGAPMRRVHPLSGVDGAELPAEATMAQGHSRPAWAEIDLSAITHNTSVLAGLAAPAELCAVVKAHGYGHGGPAVARAALAGGAQRLAVALVDEGVELREHGITGPVLLLSECAPDAVQTAIEFGLTPTLYSSEAIAAFAGGARAAGRRAAVHLKVDTGMHRVGAAPEAFVALAEEIVREPSLELEGVWTHLPVADGEEEEDRSFTEGQLDLFDRLVADLAAAGIEAPLGARGQHCGEHRVPRSRHALVRCGIGLYGYLPGAAVQKAFEEQAAGAVMRPAMALKARVVAVRELEAGERPSYGRLRPLPSRGFVATVPIGYADGVPRRAVRRGLRGADRRRPPPAGGHGHHGPDRGRLRRRRLGATRRRGGTPRHPGRRDGHGGRLGPHARNDQL